MLGLRVGRECRNVCSALPLSASKCLDYKGKCCCAACRMGSGGDCSHRPLLRSLAWRTGDLRGVTCRCSVVGNRARKCSRKRFSGNRRRNTGTMVRKLPCTGGRFFSRWIPDFVRGMHDWPYSFMIRIALTGSIGPTSCHLSSHPTTTASSQDPWLHSTIQRFIRTA